jgi:acetaldehyde dehydrogenase (acetylating)
MTTDLMPSMTLGCGAMAGNITGDNVGPLHLINTKRIAWFQRSADEALPMPPEFRDLSKPAPPVVEAAPARIDRQAIAAVIERYLAERGHGAPQPPRPSPLAPAGVAETLVDRFLAARGLADPPPACASECPCKAPAVPAAPVEPPRIEPPAPKIVIADFVCEADVRTALNGSKKIYIGPGTIVTPSARDLGEQHGILVVAQH